MPECWNYHHVPPVTIIYLICRPELHATVAVLTQLCTSGPCLPPLLGLTQLDLSQEHVQICAILLDNRASPNLLAGSKMCLFSSQFSWAAEGLVEVGLQQ